MGIKASFGPDGAFGLVGTQTDNAGRGFVPVSTEWVATSVDKVFFVAARPFEVVAINARVTVAGTNGSAVTAVVRKVASGTAIGSGTALHSGSVNLKGTANTNQTLTLTGSAVSLAAGDCLAIDFSGTLTDATGAVTVTLIPK